MLIRRKVSEDVGLPNDIFASGSSKRHRDRNGETVAVSAPVLDRFGRHLVLGEPRSRAERSAAQERHPNAAASPPRGDQPVYPGAPIPLMMLIRSREAEPGEFSGQLWRKSADARRKIREKLGVPSR